MKVQVDFNAEGARRRIEGNLNRVQAALDGQVLKDSNYFCPQDQDLLIDSSIIASEPLGQGILIWDTAYAKKQYYELPNKSKDKNPNARMKWFEVAKAQNLKKWIDISNAQYNQ